MKIVKVTKTNCKVGTGYYSKWLKCPHCRKSLSEGERVLSHSGNGKFAVHMDCLAEFLGAEPEFHNYEIEFDKIRQEYLEA